MGALDFMKDRPTLADRQCERYAPPKAGEKSRSQENAEKLTADDKAEKACKAAVWKLDKGCCRWCQRKVERKMDLLPDRAEFHHVNGRVVIAIRWDIRNLALFCRACHEKLTGKVNERFLIASNKFFSVARVQYINARKPFTYKKVA